MTEHQSHYLLLYSGLVAVSLLIQAIAVLVIAFAVSKLLKQISELTVEAKGKVYPLLEKVDKIAAKTDKIVATVEAITADLKPKIQRVTTNIADTSDVYRAKVAEVDALMTDTAMKARRQSDRVDGIVTDALTRTSAVAGNLQRAVMMPVHQLSGVFSGTKATLESLVQQFKPKPKPTTPKPVAFQGESVYTGYEDDYHA